MLIRSHLSNRRQWWTWIVAAVCVATTPLREESLPAAELQLLGPLSVQGTPDNVANISGIAFSEDRKLLFLAADEKGTVLIFKRSNNGANYQFISDLNVLPDDEEDEEADLEGLAVEGDWLYVIGSHSGKRAKVDPKKKSRAENRDRLADTDKEKSRRQLMRISIATITSHDPDIKRSKLWPRIEDSRILEPFTAIPSKENGIDIEGLAVDGERLLIGFRGPVLRGGFAVVMDTEFPDTAGKKHLFLDLAHQGIRDMARLSPGQFLVLSGPSREIDGTYRLQLWNGDDRTPGNDGPPPGTLTDLGIVPPPTGAPDAKAEGVAVLRREGKQLDVVIVYDGPLGGSPQRFRAVLP